MIRFAHRAAGAESGSALVELAFCFPILLLLLAGVGDFCRVFYDASALSSAARAGAEYGSNSVVDAADSAGMIKAAKQDAVNIPNITVSTSECTCLSGSWVQACASNYCSANHPNATYVEVDTQLQFKSVMNYPGIPSTVNLTRKCVMQVEQ